MRIVLLQVFFLSLYISMLGQTNGQIDSITKIINAATSNSVKAREYLALSKLTKDRDSVKLYLENGIKYARLAKNSELLYDGHNKMTLWLEKNENIEASIRYCKNTLSEWKDSQKYQAATYYDLAEMYKRASNIDSATFYINKGIEIGVATKKPYTVARGYMILGNYAFNKSDYKSAFEQYLKCDSICDLNDSLKVSAFHAKVYNYLGYAVRLTHGYDKVAEYYLKAKDQYVKLKDNTGIQEINIGLGQLYTNQSKYDQALTLLNEAVEFHKKAIPRNPDIYTYALIARGYFFVKTDRFAEAEKDYQEYYNLAFEGTELILQKRAAGYMGYLYKMKKEYDKSAFYYDQAISLYGKEYDYSKQLIYEEMIEMYQEAKSFKKLSETYAEYIEVRNKIETEAKNKGIFELETKYQTEKKQREIELLTTENKLAIANQAKQRNLFVGLIFIFLSAAGAFFYAYKNKIKTAEKLKEINQLKSRFFANISHEFRTPLTLIKSPLQSLQSTQIDDEQKRQLHLIEVNSNRMLELVNQLLALSKIDSGSLKLILKEGDLRSFLHSILEPFTFHAHEKNLKFESTVDPREQVYYFDKDIIEKIVTNLLTNAFKYTPENEGINFASSIVENQLHLIVTNTGSDLTEKDLPKLFERFYQKNENQQGIGIGLALVKELVELYQGKIETTLIAGVLRFSVTLPLQMDSSNAVVVKTEIEDRTITETNENKNSLPILLVIDDNPEIRKVLSSIFSNTFQVLEAADGEKGLKIAQKEIPDCIISDVMMPIMDGLLFTKSIKENELTSFIPVILLTAKTSDEAHLDALKSTADAFLTKPFNHAILKETVTQLIQERKKLHQRYSKELILKPLDIVINSIDERFLDKLQKLTNEQISNPEFSAEEFADKMGMGKMQLYRKLKSLIGLSVTEYLRTERLKAAAALLKKGNGNISEIAYSVGFNDLSYFSKCFKEMYHCSPSEFSKRETEN